MRKRRRAGEGGSDARAQGARGLAAPGEAQAVGPERDEKEEGVAGVANQTECYVALPSSSVAFADYDMLFERWLSLA